MEFIPNDVTGDDLDSHKRYSLDQEIARCLAETAEDDVALAAEFADATGDGL
jgi:hypothetical protein